MTMFRMKPRPRAPDAAAAVQEIGSAVRAFALATQRIEAERAIAVSQLMTSIERALRAVAGETEP